MNWFKSLFCDHEYEFVRNIYGDEINHRNEMRSEWKCTKCGKIEYRDHLYGVIHKDYKLCDELDKLYNECYDKRYKNWQSLRSETLNMMQKTMRDNAYNGQCWADFMLVCEEENNDRNYYEKWLTNNGLRVEIKLYNENQVDTKSNIYNFHVRWHYGY